MLQFDFACRYEVEQLERLERGGVARVLEFPGAVPLDPQQELADHPIIKVSPTGGEPWIGVFHGGDYGSPPRLLAVFSVGLMSGRSALSMQAPASSFGRRT